MPKYLRDLAKVGLLTRSEKGKLVYYKLNKENPFTSEYLKSKGLYLL